MATKDMLELLILTQICDDYWKDVAYATHLDRYYDMKKLGDRYDKLGKEFLDEYALNKTEKSD